MYILRFFQDFVELITRIFRFYMLVEWSCTEICVLDLSSEFYCIEKSNKIFGSSCNALLKLKLDYAVIVSIIPRLSRDGYGNKAMSINWRLEKYLENRGIGFVDPFDHFYRRRDLFQRNCTQMKRDWPPKKT